MSKKTNHNTLKTKDLSIGYSKKDANHIVYKNINLKVSKGSFVALLGKNGIGKSTLLRTLSGVQKPLNGSVFLNDKDVSSTSNSELATQISMVLTERLPENQLTVFELVALGRQPYTNWVDKLSNDDIQKISWALETTETKSLQSKRFYELSDGQLQRVLIARALAQDTDLILLDEPTAHLDMHHTIKIFTLLKSLAEKTNKTILISSHEINLSIQLADQLILMTDDKIYAGSTKELVSLNAFDQLFSKDLINFNIDLEQFVFQKKN